MTVHHPRIRSEINRDYLLEMYRRADKDGSFRFWFTGSDGNWTIHKAPKDAPKPVRKPRNQFFD